MNRHFIETIHGTLIRVFGFGVLIRGASGSGKSECALELVSRGHSLIADDAVVIERIANCLFGSPRPGFSGLLAVRGLGICDVRRLYGESSTADSCPIDLSIELLESGIVDVTGGLGAEQKYFKFLGVMVPSFTLANSPGRPISVIIETAVRMSKSGGNTVEMDFIDSYNTTVAG